MGITAELQEEYSGGGGVEMREVGTAQEVGSHMSAIS
jgi:hypothetical protein